MNQSDVGSNDTIVLVISFQFLSSFLSYLLTELLCLFVCFLLSFFFLSLLLIHLLTALLCFCLFISYLLSSFFLIYLLTYLLNGLLFFLFLCFFIFYLLTYYVWFSLTYLLIHILFSLFLSFFRVYKHLDAFKFLSINLTFVQSNFPTKCDILYLKTVVLHFLHCSTLCCITMYTMCF